AAREQAAQQAGEGTHQACSRAAAYKPDVFGTAGQVAGQAVYDLGGSGLPCRGGPPPTELSLEEAIERI
ncbi:hypothetical protein ACV33E_29945, partial [Pseudomonas aeruginosa]